MRPANNRADSKLLRYFIGAGTLVLALMLFSQLSCSIMGYCADWFGIPILGFWEMLGVTTALLFAYFSVRALMRDEKSSRPSSRESGLSTHEKEAMIWKSVESALKEREGEPETRDGSIQERTKERWQSFCERLTEEEKNRLKLLLEQKVFLPKNSVPKSSEATPGSK